MQVGRLRQQITLQSRVEAQDPDTGVMSVSWVNFSSTGVRTCLSLSRLVPWLLAQ